ncbi:hypothetical protein [Psychrobacter sp. DAB_AL62B]|uniref:hypothetical protein n=1 Tax=Psychrobacter sp. DAB_AL62B TaxID=1028420 RepID=UPI002380FBD6|nr:hypothetical protein [Psychrobacter sp. DAB_AL62B]MDE4454827.1 hypothetical protein [Psychrobacter sp. DAB_AL62B]
MAQDNDTSPNQEQWLSAKTIDHLKSDQSFVYPESVVEAISTIVIAVHDTYERNDNAIKYLSETIVQTLQDRPVADQYMQINRTNLAQKPLMMQLLILMQDIVIKQQLGQSVQQLVWLSIAVHTAALLIIQDKKTHTNNILMQFKMAQFSASPRRKWLWQALPDIAQTEINIERILSVFNEILKKQQAALVELNNNQATDTEEVAKAKSDAKAKLSQIEKITTVYQHAHVLQKPRPKRKKPPKNIKIKAINLADNTSTIPLDSTATSHNWNTSPGNDAWGSTRDDIEHTATAVDLAFLEANTEIYEGLTTSFEERIDHYEAPYVSYGEYPNPLIKNSIPLQTIDLSLQQNYMSQRDLALNSNTRLLSLVGYQALFAALNQDASTLPESEIHKTCAGILLLSMITGLPVKSLLIPGYIGHPSIFSIHDKRTYIKHSLGITKRSVSQTLTKENYENQSDTIKTPLPLWSVDNLLACELPVKEDFTSYIADLRSSLGLPYLSVNRIETALHVVLSRYTPDCHAHIANIICRTPASHAPAMYYSSHTSEALIAHYKSALSVLNNTGNFDLSYITPWHKYTVGSGFALKLETVRSIIDKLKVWVDQSKNDEDHFNRASIFVWFVFCLLTGVRPNNGLGKMYNIDLDMGWLEINDKPVKKVKSDRLIPLCPTLVRHLIDYRNYLIDYQAKHQSNHVISATIDDIRLGNDEALLKLLSESTLILKDVKRGDAYHMTKDIIDANPYWTRHFVRTQLERLGVQLSLINTVIGHEKARQEVLGRFSSSSKADIKRVASIFEQIAEQLGLRHIKIDNYSNLSHIEISSIEVDHANK